MWVRQGERHCLEFKDTNTSEPENGWGGECTYKVEGIRATRSRIYGFGRWLLKSLGIHWNLAYRLPFCEQMIPLFFLLQVGRKVNIYALACCLHGPLQLLTGREEWSIRYTIKIPVPICSAHVVSNTYNSTIYQRARHWPDRVMTVRGFLPGDQYGLFDVSSSKLLRYYDSTSY